MKKKQKETKSKADKKPKKANKSQKPKNKRQKINERDTSIDDAKRENFSWTLQKELNKISAFLESPDFSKSSAKYLESHIFELSN